jgi:hypothetical protein
MVPQSPTVALRLIYAFASSAGDTITHAEAIAAITAIARLHNDEAKRKDRSRAKKTTKATRSR